MNQVGHFLEPKLFTHIHKSSKMTNIPWKNRLIRVPWFTNDMEMMFWDQESSKFNSKYRKTRFWKFSILFRIQKMSDLIHLLSYGSCSPIDAYDTPLESLSKKLSNHVSFALIGQQKSLFYCSTIDFRAVLFIVDPPVSNFLIHKLINNMLSNPGSNITDRLLLSPKQVYWNKTK